MTSLFSAWAGEYAQFRPRYPQSLFEYLAQIAPRVDAAWDCATGNGQAAVGLATHFRTVYATDISAEQIAHAFPHDRIRYAAAPAEHSGLPDQSVDLVTVGLALHWLNLDAFYAEARRVLKSDGAIAVWCTGYSELSWAGDRLQAAIRRLYDVIEPYKLPPIVQLVDTHYTTIPFPFNELAVPRFSQTASWTVDQFIGCLTTWSAVQQLAHEQGWSAITPVFDDIRAAWETGDRPQPIEWPIYLRVGRVG